ncbi:dimethylmenaquinone methyltransferase [Methylobacterium aerolatum]|uniref:Regulator of RNase E activity RraA n=1 Tax=Methylobacterium aerolatum TaxID=418708 RepID=A0ABU0HUU2_9HYPH|nr:dimethylmenaquinone methyltransferase [Methylobacterium aerolatum]MDQ0445662.1 regulator of RNase E activity RraA [Methylobacterium aerolatum]GJD36229.1 4-carboxy-4-hydroxy-2-oxoadipate aldolase [Methylobacterium aerolatum]
MAIDPTLRDALSAVTLASLGKALERAGLRDFAPAGLRGSQSTTIVGPAHTMRMVPARGEGVGDLASAIESVPEGAVVVIDAAGTGRPLPFGAIVAGRLASKGVLALVTDASIAESLALPAWTAPGAAAGGLTLAGSWQAVTCGGAAIHPGDIVVCGPDGIVAIPPEKAEQIALEAVEQQRLDLWLQREAEKGESLYGLLPPDPTTLARFEAETGEG